MSDVVVDLRIWCILEEKRDAYLLANFDTLIAGHVEVESLGTFA